MFSTRNYEELKYDTVLERVSQEDIYSYYLGSRPKLSKLYRSPFRDDDRTPSLGFFVLDGSLMYKDLGRGEYTGNCVTFVKQLYGLTTYEALQMINADFKLGLGSTKYIPKVKKVVQLPKLVKEKYFQFKPRKWTEGNYQYWSEYGISKETLKYYEIFVADKVWMNKSLWWGYSHSDPIFTWVINERLKAYAPYKKPKFTGNLTRRDIQGLHKLPDGGDLLLITSSQKDLMLFREYGYWAIAPNGEGHVIPEDILFELDVNWKDIVIWYDNDEAGIKAAKKLREETGYDYIHNPIGYPKDPSDFRKKLGDNEFIELLNSNL